MRRSRGFVEVNLGGNGQVFGFFIFLRDSAKGGGLKNFGLGV